MPWRKPFDPNFSPSERGQRAYEIWVSEVMLQQTQVATVIPYWRRWLEKWPTIADLARADVEEVNGMWKGLGYYRRARSLLAGAKRIMEDGEKYQGEPPRGQVRSEALALSVLPKGRLPDDPVRLEKEVEGIGRYTAGAICSMAYGVKTPIVSDISGLVLGLALADGDVRRSTEISTACYAACWRSTRLPLRQRFSNTFGHPQRRS